MATRIVNFTCSPESARAVDLSMETGHFKESRFLMFELLRRDEVLSLPGGWQDSVPVVRTEGKER